LGTGEVAQARLTWGRAVLAVFAVALVLRVVYLFQIAGTDFFRFPVGDGESYEAWARAISRDFVGREVFYQAPLYPYLLAGLYGLFGHGDLVARAAQAVLGAAACALVADAGRRFFSRGVGVGAGVLLAVYGPALFFGGIVQKACLDLVLTSALLWAVARVAPGAEGGAATRARVLVVGVVLGALCLTRENALVLVGVLGAWLGWVVGGPSPNPLLGTNGPSTTPAASGGALAARAGRGLPSVAGRAAPRVGVFLVGVALLLGPVAIRNFALGGAPLPTTSQFGVNFYLGNHEGADGLYEPLRPGHGSFAFERADAIDLAEQASGRSLAPGEVAAYWLGLSRAWIAAHPGDWLRLLGRKWMLLWNDREIPDSDEPLVYEDASPLLHVASAVFSFGTLLPFALVGLAVTWPARRRLLILYLIAGAFALSAAFFVAFARYRVPLVPVLALFAAAGAGELVTRVRARRWRALAVPAALLLAGTIVARRPVETEVSPRATANHNLAVSLEARGDTARAMAAYRRALLDAPDFVPAHINLAAALARSGALPEAVAHARAALRLAPDDAAAHTILANALLEQGHLDEAEPHFREALRIDPGMSAAREGLQYLESRRPSP
jgi:tetratricopeptide (TPR) repeat protein